jgi:nucleoside-diphosphate-sugar epimerase
MEVWRGVQEGLNAVIVNPSVILGPGFWNSGSGSLFTKAAKGMKYFTSGASGFIDVRDVADAMIQLMESDISAERFILNAENIHYKELFDKVAEAMHVAKPKREATKNLLKIAVALDKIASITGIKKREITKEVILTSVTVSKYSNKKVKKAIGKTFLPIETSIREIAEKFKKELTIS